MKNNILFTLMLLLSLSQAITVHAGEASPKPFAKGSPYQEKSQPQTWMGKFKQWATQTVLSARLMARDFYYLLYGLRETSSHGTSKWLRGYTYPHDIFRYQIDTMTPEASLPYNKLPHEINDQMVQRLEKIIDEMISNKLMQEISRPYYDKLTLTSRQEFHDKALPILTQEDVVTFFKKNDDSWIILANKASKRNISISALIERLEAVKELIESTGDMKSENLNIRDKHLFDTITKQIDRLKKVNADRIGYWTKQEKENAKKDSNAPTNIENPVDDTEKTSNISSTAQQTLQLPDKIDEPLLRFTAKHIIFPMHMAAIKPASTTYEKDIKQPKTYFQMTVLPILRDKQVATFLQQGGWPTLIDKLADNELYTTLPAEWDKKSKTISYDILKNLMQSTGHVEKDTPDAPDKTLFDSLIKQQ